MWEKAGEERYSGSTWELTQEKLSISVTSVRQDMSVLMLLETIHCPSSLRWRMYLNLFVASVEKASLRKITCWNTLPVIQGRRNMTVLFVKRSSGLKQACLTIQTYTIDSRIVSVHFVGKDLLEDSKWMFMRGNAQVTCGISAWFVQKLL